MRQRRRRRRIITGVIAGVLCVLLLGAIVGITWIPFIRIHSVEVSGQKTIAPTEVQNFVWKRITGNYFFLFARNNIFLYPQKSITYDLIENFPTFATVSVRAKNFETISVDVTEREPAALWCGQNQVPNPSCFLMDKDGVIYAQALVYSDSAYQKYFGSISSSTLPQQYLSVEEFHTLTGLIDAIQKKQMTRISEVMISSEKDVRITYDSGFVLIFTVSTNTGDLFDRYSLAMKAQPFIEHPLSDFEYLDLRFGDKMYYKLKPLTK